MKKFVYVRLADMKGPFMLFDDVFSTLEGAKSTAIEIDRWEESEDGVWNGYEAGEEYEIFRILRREVRQ